MHFTKCALLMQDLLAAKRDLRLSREIKRLSRYDGLIIDDLGYLQQSRDDMEVVFTLLAERYERGSVLMTSNLVLLCYKYLQPLRLPAAGCINNEEWALSRRRSRRLKIFIGLSGQLL